MVAGAEGVGAAEEGASAPEPEGAATAPEPEGAAAPSEGEGEAASTTASAGAEGEGVAGLGAAVAVESSEVGPPARVLPVELQPAARRAMADLRASASAALPASSWHAWHATHLLYSAAWGQCGSRGGQRHGWARCADRRNVGSLMTLDQSPALRTPLGTQVLTVQTTAQSGDSRKVQNFCSKSHWVAQASAWRLAGEAEAAAVRAGVSGWAVGSKTPVGNLSRNSSGGSALSASAHSPATETRAEKRMVSECGSIVGDRQHRGRPFVLARNRCAGPHACPWWPWPLLGGWADLAGVSGWMPAHTDWISWQRSRGSAKTCPDAKVRALTVPAHGHPQAAPTSPCVSPPSPLPSLPPHQPRSEQEP